MSTVQHLSDHSAGAEGVSSSVIDLADKLVSFLETNVAPDGLFTDDAFCDLILPVWRLQAQGRDALVELRISGHPTQGRVARTRLDETGTGFALDVEEEWEADGQSWYCRELMRCDVAESGKVSAITVFCTGDWDEAAVARHAEAVTLIRP